MLWRWLAAVEMPFMLVSVMKYITRMFDVRSPRPRTCSGSASAKSLGVAVFSGLSGARTTQRVLAVLPDHGGDHLVATIIASLLMGDDRGREAPTGQAAAGGDAKESTPTTT